MRPLPRLEAEHIEGRYEAVAVASAARCTVKNSYMRYHRGRDARRLSRAARGHPQCAGEAALCGVW
jgi:hypothetical protein